MTTEDPATNPLSDGADDTGSQTRRTVIKRAGLATAWTVPAVQTLTMSGAWAAGSPGPPNGSGSITGQVVDATDGSPIQGATVTADSGQSDTTDASGHYTLTNVPAGGHNVTAMAGGYVSSTQGTTVPSGGTAVLNFALSNSTGGGAIRAVLTWGNSPSDLDLHVSGPVAGGGGGRFHVYYSNKRANDSTGDAYCELDIDDTDGNGPETQTITISDAEGDYVAGSYHVWVHNWSDNYLDNVNYSNSGATLNLFDRTSQVGSFSQTAASGDDGKFIWKVVEFNVDDAGNVSAVNALQTMADGSETSVF